MARKILNLDAMATETTTKLDLEVTSLALNFTVGYTDKSDPANPKSSSYLESVNLNLGNEAELDRILKEKPYVDLIAPVLANRLINGYDAENTEAKAFKDKIKNAVTPPVQ